MGSSLPYTRHEAQARIAEDPGAKTQKPRSSALGRSPLAEPPSRRVGENPRRLLNSMDPITAATSLQFKVTQKDATILVALPAEVLHPCAEFL